MPLPARLLPGAPLALALLVASPGCSNAWSCTDSTAERGRADVQVEVRSVYGDPDVTAEITQWRLEPHPQTPDDGDRAFFAYRFVPEDDMPLRVHLEACAVDADRVALACTTVRSDLSWQRDDGTLTGEEWLLVEHPEEVAGVLLVPNDRSESRLGCDDDPKDGGGTHPPEPVVLGERL